jgi:hypothetical protein
MTKAMEDSVAKKILELSFKTVVHLLFAFLLAMLTGFGSRDKYFLKAYNI